MMQRLSWDEFRLVKAIADTRSLAGAGEALGLNHSTVFRRLNSLEEQLGSRVFERSRNGYGLTAAGEEMVLLANRMADEIVDFERKVSGRDVKPSGELRVTAADTVFSFLVAPILAGFREQFPDITVEAIIENRSLNLSRRDADVAVRASREPPETLVGRRIGQLPWAAYGTEHFRRPDGRMPDFEDVPWVGLGEPLSTIPAVRWMAEFVPQARVAVRVNAVAALLPAMEAGLGYGVLPCFVGDRCPSFVRMGPPIEDSSSSLWLLTHPDLRQAARVRAFLDYAGKELSRQKRLLEGNQAA